MYEFKENVLNVNGKELLCENKIEKVVEFNNLYIVFMMENQIPRNNIFALNEDGNIIWNIGDIIHLSVPESYVTLRKMNENEIKVISASGIKWYINVFSKEIVNKQISK